MERPEEYDTPLYYQPPYIAQILKDAKRRKKYKVDVGIDIRVSEEEDAGKAKKDKKAFDRALEVSEEIKEKNKSVLKEYKDDIE